jgi:DNA-binding FrmR family transcriptional regulator
MRSDDHMATSRATAAHGYLPQKAELLTRLARIEGQVRGVARMVDEERYCIDILTQLAAVGTALEAVGLKVLNEHVTHCVARALGSGDPKEAEVKTTELLEAVQRFAKTR